MLGLSGLWLVAYHRLIHLLGLHVVEFIQIRFTLLLFMTFILIGLIDMLIGYFLLLCIMFHCNLLFSRFLINVVFLVMDRLILFVSFRVLFVVMEVNYVYLIFNNFLMSICIILLLSRFSFITHHGGIHFLRFHIVELIKILTLLVFLLGIILFNLKLLLRLVINLLYLYLFIILWLFLK